MPFGRTLVDPGVSFWSHKSHSGLPSIGSYFAYPRVVLWFPAGSHSGRILVARVSLWFTLVVSGSHVGRIRVSLWSHPGLTLVSISLWSHSHFGRTLVVPGRSLFALFSSRAHFGRTLVVWGHTLFALFSSRAHSGRTLVVWGHTVRPFLVQGALWSHSVRPFLVRVALWSSRVAPCSPFSRLGRTPVVPGRTLFSHTLVAM